MILHLPHADGGFGVTFNAVTKDAAFYTTTFIPLLDALSPGLVLFPRNVRACGCPKMVFRTRPLGHRPRFYSSVTCTPSFSLTMGVRRSVRRLSHRRKQGLVVDSAPRTVMMLSSRRLLLFFFRSSTGFLKPITCGERMLPTCPPSRRSTA